MNKRQQAFTLIELLIVVTLISILAFVGTNSYQNSVLRSKQIQAQADLLKLGLRMEQHYANKQSYLGLAGSKISPTNTGLPWIYSPHSPSQLSDSNKSFTLSIRQVAADGQSFIIEAKPTGKNSKRLKAMLYTSLGERELDLNKNGSFERDEFCWDCD